MKHRGSAIRPGKPGAHAEDSKSEADQQLVNGRPLRAAVVITIIVATVVTTIATLIRHHLPPVAAQCGKSAERQHGNDHHGCGSLHLLSPLPPKFRSRAVRW